MNSNNLSDDSSTIKDGIVHSSQTSPIRSLGITVKIEKGLSTIHWDFLVDSGDTATIVGSRGNPITELVSSATPQIASPPRIRAGRSIIITPVTRDSEALVLYSPNATLVGKTHPRDNNTWVRPIDENSTSLDICIHKIASSGKAVTLARIAHETALSSFESPPTPDRPKKKQNQNTTPERLASILFVIHP